MKRLLDKNIIGSRYDKLVIISDIVQMPSKSGKIYGKLLCQCDCGSDPIWIVVGNITKGLSKSCGCEKNKLSSERYKILGKITGPKLRKYPHIESIARDLYSKYMKRKPGDLTFEQFYSLTQKKCNYCDTEPKQLYRDYGCTTEEGKGEKFIYNGLDRVDNSLPYNMDNVVPCCGTCNRMKMAMTYEDFINHLSKVFRKLNIGEDSAAPTDNYK